MEAKGGHDDGRERKSPNPSCVGIIDITLGILVDNVSRGQVFAVKLLRKREKSRMVELPVGG